MVNLGVFAFTLLVPLILFGNGVGAIIVRQLTVRNIENEKIQIPEERRYVFYISVGDDNDR